MKINKLMLALLAGAMFASCSDDRSNEPLPDNNAVGSEGYIGISIGMPAPGMSRGLNDDFNDGRPSEYGITGAALIFFTGTEQEAKFYKAYSIGRGEWNQVADNPNQITQNRIVTFPVDFAKTNENLWVLAVINPGSVLTANEDHSLTVGGTAFSGTFAEFLALKTSETLIGTNQFFMTNSPYSSVAGTITSSGKVPTTGTFRTLSPVNKDRIFATQQAAEGNPAAAIFVERAVAKVEVNDDDIKVANGAINFPKGSSYNITNVDWALNNTEPTTFLVRNLDFTYDVSKPPYWAFYDTNSRNPSLIYHYRFLGNAGFGHTFWPNTPDPDEHYRTYFCVDPNGNGIDEGTVLNPAETDETIVFTNTGSDYPQYCYENTFDVAHMDYRNTTRAVIKVQFGSSAIYTVGEDKKNVYTFDDAASYLTYGVLYDVNVVAAWKAYFKKNNKVYENDATTQNMVYDHSTHTAYNEWMKITFFCNDEVGRLQVTGITLFDGAGKELDKENDFTNAAEIDAMNSVNENVSVKYYKEGAAYYAVRIRHFGNDLAPWTAPEKTTNTTQDSYSGITEGDNTIDLQDIKNYLGRYGVVRNNWYVLNLGSINQMGEPVVGDLPLDGTPDDRVLKEESISCRINILSWAKREQSDSL